MTIDGRIALTTPEGVRLLLTPAGPAIRGLAWAVDTVLWVLATMAIGWSIVMALGETRLASGVYLLLYFVVFWTYPVVCEVYFNGQTIGKKIVGLEVVRDNGLPVGWRESALRNLLMTADFLPLFYVTGLVCMLCDGRFRRIGDLAAGTLVVYRERQVKRDALPLPEVEPVAPPWPLTVTQQRTLADLLARERSLPEERMLELATLAEPLTGRTGIASLERLRGIVAGLAR